MTTALLKGFILQAGLIVAIGAQNAFVLKQGLIRNHVLLTVLLCASIDALLISIGIGGFGTLVASNLILLSIAKWGGAAFLIFYGGHSLWNAFKKQTLKVNHSDNSKKSLKETLLVVLAVSFLNPHCLLDTVVLIGSLGAQFPFQERIPFGLGAILFSYVWFFALGYGARLLVPLFKNPTAWKVLDVVIAIVMFVIAASLLIA